MVFSDVFSRLQNASRRGHSFVDLYYSKRNEAIASILYQEGFIRFYSLRRENKDISGFILRILLKNKNYFCLNFKQFSKSGCRNYLNISQLVRFSKKQSQRQIFILTTSKGLLTQKEALKQNTGGEILVAVSI